MTSCATVRACAFTIINIIHHHRITISNPSQADGGERKQPVAALLARCPSPFVPSAHHIYYILTVHWNGGATAPVQLLIHPWCTHGVSFWIRLARFKQATCVKNKWEPQRTMRTHHHIIALRRSSPRFITQHQSIICY